MTTDQKSIFMRPMRDTLEAYLNSLASRPLNELTVYARQAICNSEFGAQILYTISRS